MSLIHYKGIAGHVASTGEAVLLNSLGNESRFNPDVDQVPDKTPTQNILCLPILNENEDILGVIEMINKECPFTEKDAQLLKSLTHQIFQSLSNAELFQKTLSGFNAALVTQQKYQTLLEVAESLTSQLDEDILISYIMKR